jgi:hypothetical protein
VRVPPRARPAIFATSPQPGGWGCQPAAIPRGADAKRAIREGWYQSRVHPRRGTEYKFEEESVEREKIVSLCPRRGLGGGWAGGRLSDKGAPAGASQARGLLRCGLRAAPGVIPARAFRPNMCPTPRPSDPCQSLLTSSPQQAQPRRQGNLRPPRAPPTLDASRLRARSDRFAL